MKKTSLRVASLLLALVLMTSCFVGGTFARYITKDEGSDSARVAKFGVVASITGSLFAENYYSKDGGNTVAVEAMGCVDSGTGENIVAPGTKNDKGMVISLTGTPEVAVKVVVKGDAFHDIYLIQGAYGVMVEAEGVNEDNVAEYYVRNDDHTFKRAIDFDATGNTSYYKLKDLATATGNGEYSCYYPIVYYYQHNSNSKINCVSLNATGGDNVFGDYIASSDYGDYEALDNLEENNKYLGVLGINRITWEWPIREDDESSACDTILGDLIAYDAAASAYEVVAIDGDTITGLEIKEKDGGKYAYIYDTNKIVAGLTAAFNYSITVTQID